MIKKIYYADIIGSSIPVTKWEGSVQPIYSKAVNLFHPSGYLISIVDSIDNMTDFGLVITGFSSLISEISNGSHFLWEGSKIIFSDIIVDISGASVWSGVISGNSFKINTDFVSIKRTFSKFAAREGLSPVITQKAGNMYSNAVVKKMEEAEGSADLSNGLLIDLSFLIGLGIGFTPSGDDFLTGVMLYEVMSGTKLINRETIKAKITGTTEGGRTLLSLGLDNSFPYYLKHFAELLLEGEYSPSELVKNTIKHGSTSGSDALTGFLWAVEKNEKID
ncbi:MAG: DUF2877 domain-containing protein [Spirochaetales bacterium]|nr:DUF2877 domain-containing protein [Spirochaetales bacterium]